VVRTGGKTAKKIGIDNLSTALYTSGALMRWSSERISLSDNLVAVAAGFNSGAL
jgi:hypothetical protein